MGLLAKWLPTSRAELASCVVLSIGCEKVKGLGKHGAKPHTPYYDNGR